ncbi:serine protease grass-like [Drosophila hydei]|uniref:CLIP domain-containing serine protease n=1 Tax=Drosophila hydei TaxID=7224 RepID=A0A6J1MHR1_DROHY|nr:serine protease grass-like [Drosophila hydei]
MNVLLALSLVLYVALSFGITEADENYENCVRKDGISGACVPLNKCPRILQLFNEYKTISNKDKLYLRNSQCPNRKKNHVCCEEMSPGMRLLNDQDCGYFGGKIKTVGGNKLKLMSRPWMALLRLQINGTSKFACGGTLITPRFVLTAAHCIEGNNEFKLVYVRLGEHSISNKEDCDVINNQTRCAPPYQDVLPERTFTHKDYNHFSGVNDIALIKLSEDARTTRNIRPICLPLNDTLQELAETLSDFRVTGWGFTEAGIFSDVPTEVEVPRRTCRQSSQRQVESTQLCAGTLNRDSCRGDSGGPLFELTGLYKESQKFVQFGIVSYGSQRCGDGHPGVYTNVAHFMHWISDTIGNNN